MEPTPRESKFSFMFIQCRYIDSVIAISDDVYSVDKVDRATQTPTFAQNCQCGRFTATNVYPSTPLSYFPSIHPYFPSPALQPPPMSYYADNFNRLHPNFIHNVMDSRSAPITWPPTMSLQAAAPLQFEGPHRTSHVRSFHSLIDMDSFLFQDKGLARNSPYGQRLGPLGGSTSFLPPISISQTSSTTTSTRRRKGKGKEKEKEIEIEAINEDVVTLAKELFLYSIAMGGFLFYYDGCSFSQDVRQIYEESLGTASQKLNGNF